MTQRVDSVTTYQENRDALDQRWVPVLMTAGLMPILVPNNIDYVTRLLDTSPIKGLLLTGGNSLVDYGGASPERDEVERVILKYAIDKKNPDIGDLSKKR